uniref:Uncharacterized protein n=1 Tax=Glossina austeni TaxID=7395 RepID=A0A1A9VQK0_GLOAU
MKAMVNKKQAQTALENIIKGRRLTLAIKTGPKNDVAKFKQPAPKLAHSAPERRYLLNVVAREEHAHDLQVQCIDISGSQGNNKMRSDVPKIFRKLNTWPTTTPPVTPTAQNTPKAPRKAKGAISVKYIGKVAVVKPEAKPTNKRPNINISTELAIRQKENIIPPIINNKPLMRKHPFLYIGDNLLSADARCKYLLDIKKKAAKSPKTVLCSRLPSNPLTEQCRRENRALQKSEIPISFNKFLNILPLRQILLVLGGRILLPFKSNCQC